MEFTKREELVELVNKLFLYTDSRAWDKLLKEVFAEQVVFDMSSMGAGNPEKISAKVICDRCRDGFEGLDAIHHQAGNYIVTLKEDGVAEVICYAIASHYKKSARNGQTRNFVGSYTIITVLTDVGWRINGFKYSLKYHTGNASLE